MTIYPNVDPIPLPAPVWLFKLLHIVTLALHFVAMEILVGALLVATILSLFRRSASAGTAAAAMARRLPIVMTYVINLGVPPLLFAQVLYGRALYTSSVIIGVYWICVIPALVLLYWLLYRFAAGLEEGRRVWWMGLIAWIIAAFIARVYTSNMTLMLRPEVWQKMYSNSSLGAHLPHGDPTILPRFLFVMATGFVMAGLWMLYLASRKSFSEGDRHYLAAVGGRIAAIAAAAQIVAAIAVQRAQPAIVQAGLHDHAIYRIAGLGWIVLAAVVLVWSAAASLLKPISGLTGWLSGLLGFLCIALETLYRDGIRDLTLLSKGYDVWQRVVVTNWSVVVLFLLLFVGGLAVAGWLISVVARATRVMESPVNL
jgi:hypothetical protein